MRVASHDGKSVIDRNTGKRESNNEYEKSRKEREQTKKEKEFRNMVSDPGNIPNDLHPVYAVRGGIIGPTGRTPSDAFRVGVYTGDGYRDNYIHLAPNDGYYAPEGTRVEPGDIIGFVADPTNGRGSTNPHVHLERIDENTLEVVHPGWDSPLINGKDATGWFMESGGSYPEAGHRGIDFPI